MRIVAENLVQVTGGDLGIMLRERTWIGKTPYYYIILLLAVGAFATTRQVLGSKLGYYFLAIREEQEAAESLGIDTTRYKTIALVHLGGHHRARRRVLCELHGLHRPQGGLCAGRYLDHRHHGRNGRGRGYVRRPLRGRRHHGAPGRE